MFIAVLIIYTLLSVGGLTLFKLGAQQTLSVGISSTAFSLSISWLSLLGLTMYVCSFLIYMALLSKMDLSFLMPVLTGAVYILTLFVSLFVFHETFSVLKIIGTSLVFFGVIIMNISK